MKSILYIGMDVHKGNYMLCSYSFDEDKVQYKQTVAPDYKLILKYLEQIRVRCNDEVELPPSLCARFPSVVRLSETCRANSRFLRWYSGTVSVLRMARIIGQSNMYHG